MSSKIISKILNNKQLSETDRVRLIREWFKTEYRLKDIKDNKFLSLVSEVHDHDNLPLHFGEVNVGTSFNASYVRILEVNEGWHLAVSKESGKNFNVIHPNYEQAGSTAENLKHLNIVKSLLKSGSVNVPLAGVVYNPPAMGTQAVMSVRGLEETIVDEDALTEAPVSVSSVSQNGTTSLTINMDDYLK